MNQFRRFKNHISKHGFAKTSTKCGSKLLQRIFCTYDRSVRRREQDAAMLLQQRANQPAAGLISIVVPIFNTDPMMLKALADSLTAQTYNAWEAIFYNGGSTKGETQRALDEIHEPRIRIVHGRENLGISGNTNAAIALSRGDYVAFCDHDDLLAPDALWHTAQAIESVYPDMLYTDEDRVSSDGRYYSDPHRKPDFNHAALCEGNYICHLMTVKRTLLDELGGLRPEYDGSQDHDLALRISEATDSIVHIPLVLYHWRRVKTSVSQQRLAQCEGASARAVRDHLAKMKKREISP